MSRSNDIVQDKELLFDAKTAVVHPKNVEDVTAQEEMESRRLWRFLTDNLLKKNFDQATTEKGKVEARQREIPKESIRPRFFAKQVADNGEETYAFIHPLYVLPQVSSSFSP